MQKLKTGIIGTGKVGHLHAAALRELPESEFTAVCNVNFKGAQAFAEQRRANAIATEQEMKAAVAQNRAAVVLAQAEVPLAMAHAFREGHLFAAADASGNGHPAQSTRESTR